MAYKLPNDKVADLRKALDDLNECRALCEKATNCGIDVDAIDRMEQALRPRLMAIKEEFTNTKRRE